MRAEINKCVFEKFPVLESERLLFRNFQLSDSEDLFLIRSNDDVMRFMDSNKMESKVDAEKFIQFGIDSYETKNGINWGIIEKSSNSYIGYVGYWRMVKEHCRAEIGYALNPKYWGCGYMSESLKIMIDYGFNELHLHSIEANVNPQNEKSIKLLEKAGFKKEAHFRENFLYDNKFLDTATYSLLEKDLNK